MQVNKMLDEFSFDHPSNQGFGNWKRLNLLSKEDPFFAILEKKFRKGWKHPDKPRPHIYGIFKILSSPSSLKPYQEYRARIAGSPKLKDRSVNPANEQLLFHGTNRRCQLAEDGTSTRLCDLPECHVCCIIRGSYDVEKCGTKHKFRRFGTGIYTTACSSKADDYTSNSDDSKKLRVLLVNRVVVGEPHKRKHNVTRLTEPPCGYHSVIGEPGGDLNYEETVVYDNDAIRPAFLIVYGEGAPSRRKFKEVLKLLFKTPLVS